MRLTLLFLIIISSGVFGALAAMQQSPTNRLAVTGMAGSVASSSSLGSRRSRFLFLRKPAAPVIDARPPVSPYNQRGVYLTAGSMNREQFREETIDRLLQAGGSTIVFDVKGSNVYFHSNATMASELGLVKPLYDLPWIVQRAREKGIYTIGRFISLKDGLFSSLTPEAQIRHPRTGVSVGNVWVDGSRDVVLEYNRQILRDLLKSGIDEVNLDYIRYPTEYAQASIGLSGKEKADRIEPFIRMVRETINEINPDTKLGLSTYAIMGWNYPVNLEAIGQDFVRYASMVDVISPMAYPSTFAAGAYYVPGKNPRSRMYYLVYRTLTGYAELLGPEHKWKIRPWIQGYGVTTKDIRDQIDAVYDAGSCGFTVWNAGNHYESLYAALKGKTDVPEHCL